MDFAYYIANPDKLDRSTLFKLRVTVGKYPCFDAARLLLLPVVMVCILWPVPIAQEIKLTLLLLGAASVGTNVALYAQRAGLDYRPATGMVCLSTLLSVVTMPMIMALATLVWN